MTELGGKQSLSAVTWASSKARNVPEDAEADRNLVER